MTTMMVEMYDALRAINVPDEQARQCATVMNFDRLATKDDLAHTEQVLRGEIKALGDALRGEIKTLGNELRGEISALDDKLRGEIKALGDALRDENKALRVELRDEIKDVRAEVRSVAASVEQLGRRMTGLYLLLSLVASAVTIELVKNLFVH